MTQIFLGTSLLRYTKGDNYKFNPPREPYSPTAPSGYEKEKYYHPDGKVVGDVWQINMGRGYIGCDINRRSQKLVDPE